MRLSVMQQIAGVLCFALVALIVAANLGCAPKYFQRGDVIALLAIGLLDGVLLLGASSGDSDTHRVAGVAASASAATLFLATVSIPVVFARRDRWRVPDPEARAAPGDRPGRDSPRDRRDRGNDLPQRGSRDRRPAPLPLAAGNGAWHEACSVTGHEYNTRT